MKITNHPQPSIIPLCLAVYAPHFHEASAVPNRKKRLFYALLLTFSSLIVMGTAGQAQNLILNGQFTANASAYSNNYGEVSISPTDWTATANNGDYGENGPGTDSSAPTKNLTFAPTNATTDNMGNSIGDFFFMQHKALSGGLPNTASPMVSQSFDVVAGMSYLISYDAGVRASTDGGDSNNDGILAQIIDDDPASTILFNQTSTLPENEFYLNSSTGTNPNNSDPLFTTTTGTSFDTFTADQTGVVTLSFTAYGGATTADYSAAVTNVSITAVPEPGVLALSLIGLGALVLAVRCRSISL